MIEKKSPPVSDIAPFPKERPLVNGGSHVPYAQINEDSSGSTGCNTPPSHYRELGIEPIEYLKANLSPEAYCGFLEGNVLKYISRYKDKDGLKDLRKCRTYLEWLIDYKS